MRHDGMTRREFNNGMAAAALVTGFSSGCSGHDDGPSYENLAASIWRHTEVRPTSKLALQQELIRYATLAPNSHNSQPWLFRNEPDRIVILPDFSRRCAAVDPDDHHLFVTLGCATENIVLAAAAFGLQANVTVDVRRDGEIVVDLEAGTQNRSALFEAIPERQSTRAAYDGRAVTSVQLAALESAAQSESVGVQFFTDQNDLEAVLEYVIAGNTAQLSDKAFVEELRASIRFNESAAVEHRDGLFSASSGNPTAPSWLGNLMFRFAFTEDGENDKYRDHIRSSAGIIAFVSQFDTKEGWISVGRSCQRFALRATALGLRHAYINQPVEVPEVRRQFAEYLGIGEKRPDLLLRFGYGPTLPRSLRRLVKDVLV